MATLLPPLTDFYILSFFYQSSRAADYYICDLTTPLACAVSHAP